MNHLERMYARMEKRKIDKVLELRRKIVSGEETARLFHICGLLWEKGTKEYKKQLKEIEKLNIKN